MFVALRVLTFDVVELLRTPELEFELLTEERVEVELRVFEFV